MNTQTRVHRLQAGQALPPMQAKRSSAILTEGELLVQAPARWLGGTVIVPRPTRLVAPAVVPSDASVSAVAVGGATVVVADAVPLLPIAGWVAAAARWIRGWQGTPRQGRRAQGQLAN